MGFNQVSATRATIADVAKRAGVSIATVSRVVNNTGTVTETTAVRVQTAVAELNYIPHLSARNLASRRTNTLGLVFPEISGVFFSALLRGIEQTVTKSGYALLIYSTQGRQSEEREFYLPLGEHNTDGLIVFTDSLSEEMLVRLHQRRFPLVLLHRSPPAGTNIPCVTFENKNGARQLVEHLIGCGHRRIAYLAGPPEHEDSYWREIGYREALAAHNIPFDPSLIRQGGFHDKIAADTITQWCQDGLDVDAIFAGDDESARGTLYALQQAGYHIPDDIAVAGFDDALLSQYLTPPLTTVRAPIEAAGQAAAQQLIQLIRTETAVALTLLSTELIIRQSCGYKNKEVIQQKLIAIES